MVAVDNNSQKVTVLSILRASRVKIPKYGWDKVKPAFAFGRVALSKKTVGNLLGVPIDYTVVVDFRGFIRMVMLLGKLLSM